MKFFSYFKDKLFNVLVSLIFYVVVMLLFFAFKVDKAVVIVFSLLCFFSGSFILLVEFFVKRRFYNELIFNINELDKAYLVLETLKIPSFYEGKLVCNSLYEINKSMNENVNLLSRQISDFKDYIEMWIHEVKIPLASCILKVHNNKDKYSDDMKLQLKRVDDYLEQVLYYVRSENASKDYFISKVSLGKCINNVLVRNKDYLLESEVNLDVQDIDVDVYTDSKWLEFIVNQIINNCIKYKKKENNLIKIYLNKIDDEVSLFIEDNGIGIGQSDLCRVFEKSFTGKNGRDNVKSTGMGLFIVKSLCDKLGHKISIESKLNSFTRVKIVLSTNKFYDEVR